jgi:hypothetical protein
MRKSASETTNTNSQRRLSGVNIPKRQSLGAIRQTSGEARLSRGSPRRQSAPVKVQTNPPSAYNQYQKCVLSDADFLSLLSIAA